MGLFDNLRDRLTGGFQDDYDDDYYDDDYDDDYEEEEEPAGTGLLGNTPRPEAESVAVYTRSGRPVSTNAGTTARDTSSRTSATSRPSASSSSRQPSARQSSSARQTTGSRSSSGYSSSYRRSRDDYEEGFDDYAPSGTYTAAAQQSQLNSSGQLPPYVLRVESYEDVQTVVRRVKTNQPVLLVLDETPGDVAQRVLDFCFGLSFGIDGDVSAVSEKAFVVLPANIQLSPAELDRLALQAR